MLLCVNPTPESLTAFADKCHENVAFTINELDASLQSEARSEGWLNGFTRLFKESGLEGVKNSTSLICVGLEQVPGVSPDFEFQPDCENISACNQRPSAVDV